MLSERFLARLHDELPSFYAQVEDAARLDAERYLAQANGDRAAALARARIRGAARVWWPYAKGSLPFVGERDAMKEFTRLVLTVDHLVGRQHATPDEAREHVVAVLRRSLDVERLKRIFGRDEKEAAKGAAAATGLLASASALMAPLTAFRQMRGALRFVPPQARLAAAAVVAAALLSVPLVAGYSAGLQAERADAGRALREDAALRAAVPR